MKLYLMRHGPAEDDAPSGLDADRALSPSGRVRVSSVARALVDLGEPPAHVFSSPLVRAVQTAEIIALETGLGERGGVVAIRDDLAPGGETRDLAAALAAEGPASALLVGHEPDLSALAGSLVGAFHRPFDKAMVVAVELSAGSPRGRLRFVLDPRTLQLQR